MTPLAIVEDLDVVEHGVRELESGSPVLAVQEFVLHARPERLHHGVVERVAHRSE